MKQGELFGGMQDLPSGFWSIEADFLSAEEEAALFESSGIP